MSERKWKCIIVYKGRHSFARLLTDKAPRSIRQKKREKVKQRRLRGLHKPHSWEQNSQEKKEEAGDKQAEREQRQDGGQGRAGQGPKMGNGVRRRTEKREGEKMKETRGKKGEREELKRDTAWGWLQTGHGLTEEKWMGGVRKWERRGGGRVSRCLEHAMWVTAAFGHGFLPLLRTSNHLHTLLSPGSNFLDPFPSKHDGLVTCSAWLSLSFASLTRLPLHLFPPQFSPNCLLSRRWWVATEPRATAASGKGLCS